ncbi:MAG TPA: thioredoxin fold domain-containing protein [Gemmatimonadales bacterium]|nr:thioredoxin fold domain-containing protein [Gemmatimonadales bacterium]
MDAEVWPDDRVVRFVSENFVPARVHVKDDAKEFQRYGTRYNAQWTPTILELDSDGVERHRIEGFLPADDFLAQLMLGRAHMAFKEGQWAEAEKRFREIGEKLPNSDAAPEALYWAGVARYKASGDGAALKETARAFTRQFQDSTWAKKASIWK